jgi:transcriptional regulator with XRE-family HTH domain
MRGTNEGVVSTLIRNARKAAGLSQDALAEAVGVSQQTVGKWEAGTRRPTVDNLVAMAAAMPEFDPLEVVLILWPELAGPRPRRARGSR